MSSSNIKVSSASLKPTKPPKALIHPTRHNNIPVDSPSLQDWRKPGSASNLATLEPSSAIERTEQQIRAAAAAAAPASTASTSAAASAPASIAPAPAASEARRPSKAVAEVPLRSVAELETIAGRERAAAAAISERRSTPAPFELRLGQALIGNEKAALAAKGAAGARLALNDLLREWDRNKDGQLQKVEFRQAVRGSLQVDATNTEIDAMYEAPPTKPRPCCLVPTHAAQSPPMLLSPRPCCSVPARRRHSPAGEGARNSPSRISAAAALRPRPTNAQLEGHSPPHLRPLHLRPRLATLASSRSLPPTFSTSSEGVRTDSTASTRRTPTAASM